MTPQALKLENQLCFPLYAAAKEVVRRYKPLLKPLGLTYTQYIAMMVLWEHEKITVSNMGKLLMLDSGTLTPMLKKMEAAGLVKRKRNEEDEREIIVSITRKALTFKKKPSRFLRRWPVACPLTSKKLLSLKFCYPN